MNLQDKTKQELFDELQELRQSYDSLLASSHECIQKHSEIEEILKTNNERLNLAINATEQGIWDWNVEADNVYYSSQWKNQIGYADDELENEFSIWVEHLHPDDKERCESALQEYLRQPAGHFNLEFRFRHKNGSYRWIHSKASSLQNNEGKVIRMFGSHTDITVLKQSEAIFKDIIEKNPMSIQILDMDGLAIQTNAAHTKLFGVKPPPDYSVLKDPQLLALGFDEFFDRIKKGEVVYFPDSFYNVHELDSSFPDTPVWVRAFGFALNNFNGVPEKIVFIHENITDRKHAETLFTDIIEKNPMSIQIVDKNGFTLHGNPSYLNLFGAFPPADFSIFDDLQRKSPELEKLILLAKSGEVVHLPDVYFNAHDVVPDAPDIPLWIRALIFPLNDSKGKPDRFVFMHENITDRKLAEQELVKAKQIAIENEIKYRQIFDNTFDLMAIFEVTEDHRFKVITFNAAEEKLLGPLENYQNRFIDEFFPADLYKEIIPHYERCITLAKQIEFEGDISFKDINKTFHSQLIPLKNEDNRIYRIIVISRDITENKILQSQLIEQNEKLKLLNIDLIHAKDKAEESDRLKTAFLANMSHEIRTPMNGILGFSELLKTPGLTGNQQEEYIGIIEKSGKRMLNIINDIIDISKIEAGLMKTDVKETNINEQVEYIYTFFKPEVETKGLKFTYNCGLPAKNALLKTDREKLYSILTNLVKNAIKYTPSGSIDLGYDLISNSQADNAPLQTPIGTTQTKMLQFYVKDTGIGIPADRQQAIFDRFVQADIEDKHARQGAGLGLSITKAYVEMLGGTIGVESNEGHGSIFYFTLPYDVVADELMQKRHNSVADIITPQTAKLKILIAEDDGTSEVLLSILIKDFSSEIYTAHTGSQAVELCRSYPDIDLIFMDIQMPDLNGYEATRQIRQFNKDVIIVAQTAFGLYGDREKAIKAGCDDYIPKPIDAQLLKELLYKYSRNQKPL